MQEISQAIGVAMGLGHEEQEILHHGALVHDVGKVGIPDRVLLKDGQLTSEEYALMKNHTIIGDHLCAELRLLHRIRPIVRHHHENWDGTGYPRGVAGDAIPIGARIFAIVDAYDAMRSDRSYRKAMPIPAAIEEIVRHIGTQFDPKVVKVFLECQTDMETVLARGRD